MNAAAGDGSCSNPYVGFGTVVSGSRLVGRSSEISRIQSQIESRRANVSLHGIPRIGKSSVAQEVVRRVRASSADFRCIEFDAGTVDDGAGFWSALLDPLRGAVGVATDASDGYARLRRTLASLPPNGSHIVGLIDEFDAVLQYPDADLTMRRLRELIGSPQRYRMTVLVVSRRSLHAIQRRNGNVSTLAGVCAPTYLRPLAQQDLATLVGRCPVEIRPGDFDMSHLEELCGGHPFLAEMLMFHSIERGSATMGFGSCRSEMVEYYNQLRGILEEDELFDALLQLSVGPRTRISQEAVERLEAYGVLRVERRAEVTRTPWSAHFLEYLELLSRQSSLDSVWRDTEQAIRDLVDGVMTRIHGEHWASASSLEAPARDALGSALERCRREAVSFGVDPGRVLDYTYPAELWLIIQADWESFQPVLKNSKRYWADRFELLARIRTPIAHSRDRIVPEHLVTTARGYCEEILRLIRSE